MCVLNKPIADALCTVITLGFARENEKRNKLCFEYDKDEDKAAYEKVKILFAKVGVCIDIGKSVSQAEFPYILGTDLTGLQLENFKKSLNVWVKEIDAMMNEANEPDPNKNQTSPQGAYIGVQILVDGAGDIVDDPSIYGPSSLSLHRPIFRMISPEEQEPIAIAYRNAVMNTNAAVLAITRGLHVTDYSDFNIPYKPGHLFGSGHGMIRAMVNRRDNPPGCDSVFAEIALGSGTTKVSSCLPCALFMQSFGYPASSIHLGRGDNWRIPDSPSDSVLKNWKDYIRDCYKDGLQAFNPDIKLATNNIILGAMVERIIRQDAQEIPNLFLESLTFEDSFTNRIISAFASAGITV
ncbi:MAG: hypothetical protein LBG43_07270 [Treponema sp.]|jgi:hypothetical protein|nr:hypothetical protein [Treponema sp.]